MNPKSFVKRLQQYLPALLRQGTRLTGTRSEAEDLAQDTIMRALEKQSELRSPERMAGWLSAIQKTVHLNGRRNLRPQLEVLEGGASTAPEPSKDLRDELSANELDESLARALDALPPEWREALWLREVEELSYEEIAAAQRCPIGTVRSRLARAREAMLSKLGEEKRREHL